MRRLARFSLSNRALVALITVFVLVFGVLSARALKQELIPSLQLPVAAVVTTYPGASPAVVDEQISRPLADAVKTVDGLEKVTSTASSGSSVVSVQVKYGTDLDRVQSQLQSAVNRLQSTFPDTADSQVIAGSFDDFPVIQLAVASDLDAQSLKTRLDATAVSSLSRLDGVRDVTVSGARALQVRVDLDQAKLRKQNLTATDVTNALQTNGTRRSGGQIDTGGDTLSIDVGVPFGTVQQIRDLPLVPSSTATPRATPGANPGPNPGAARAAPALIPTPAAPKPIALSQVATVTEVPAPATGYARVDGKPALTLGVTKTPDGNTVTVSDDVRAQLAGISDQVGGNTTFTVVFDQAPFITQSIDDLTTEGVLGLVMAIVVILVFLLSVRSTLVTAVSIPMSLLVTMIVLRALGYSLNILTLAALTIAIGRVVDDSIVVIENIKRHLAGGEEKLPAILTAIGEVAGAVTASTATTVAVFAPIAFVGGQVGELFRPFAVTVAVALLASLFVSLTIVPVLAYWWLGSRRSTHPHTARTRAGGADVTRLQRGYLPVLTRALRHPIVTIAIAVLILGGTVALVPQLQTNFLGDSGQNTLTVSQNLPAGSSLASTDRAARRVETAIGSVPG